MLVGIIVIYFQVGTTDVQILMQTDFTYYRQLFL